MPVLINNKQKKHRLPVQKILKKATAVLNALGNPDAELSLLITDDNEISRFNKQYLGRNGPTNVIAFPMAEGEFSDVTPDLLGDVVISADTASREAGDMNISMEERFTQLLIHASDQQAEEMDRKAEEMLKIVKTL